MANSKVFRTIKELCTGCQMCELVCSLEKTGTINPYLSRIKVVRSEKTGSNLPIICRHCKNPRCQQACPVPDAMFLDQQTGAVVIRATECIGCSACVDACPFGAIQIGPNREILKCDLCLGDPQCVRYCPPRPAQSLPHLPWPEQSCLRYAERRRPSEQTTAPKIPSLARKE